MKNKVAAWMMQHGYATGHGDTVEELLKELVWQVREGEREECAKVADSWNRNVVWEAKTVSMNIAKEIRARGEKK